jgi:hypothetical protein
MIERIEQRILQLIDQGNLVLAAALTEELTQWKLHNEPTGNKKTD